MARPGFWIDTKVDLTIAIGTQQLKSLMTNVSATQSRRGWTLVRTIIGMDVAYTVHDAGEGSQDFVAGIGVASQEAFAAGTVSDPNTETDHPISGWIWRAKHRIFGFAADQPAIFTRRIDLDIRAKRKLQNGEVFIAADIFAHEGAATTVDVTGMIRQYWLDE